MSIVESGEGRPWVEIGTQQGGPHSPVAVEWAVADTAADPWIEGDYSWCPGTDPSFETLLQRSGPERMSWHGSHRDDGLEVAVGGGTIGGWLAIGCLGESLRLLRILLLRAPGEHLQRRDDDLGLPVALAPLSS